MEQLSPRNILVMLDPGKYGYEQCPQCNGYGSSLKEASSTCTRCGGSGLVKKQAQPEGKP